MTLVTLRPDSTTVLTGGPVTGAASAHLALADDDDASYVALASSGLSVGLTMADLALPVGAMIVSTQIRARVSVSAGNATYIAIVGSPPTGYLLIYQQAALTISFPLDLRVQTDAFVDAYTLSLVRLQGKPTPAYLFAVYLDVIYAAKPTLVVSAPAGAITQTNLPAVTWASTLDEHGGPQTAYEVRIFSAAQYNAGGFDPATSPATVESGKVAGSATTWTPPVTIPDGTYRAYVRVYQEFRAGNGHASAFAFSAFTVAVALPSPPSVVLAAIPGGLRVTVDDVGGGATTQAVDLERSTDGGTTWEPLRSALGLETRFAGTPAPLVVDDHEVSAGAVTYRARALHDYNGQWAASAWTVVAGAWSTRLWWITHPARPALNVELALKTYGAVARGARQLVVQPLGASLPVAMSDKRLGPAGQLTVRTNTQAELDALNELLAAGGTLLTRGPAGCGEPDRYMQIGDVAEGRLVEQERWHERDVTLSWVEVTRPTDPLVIE